MLFAAKTIGLAGALLMKDSSLLADAKQEYDSRIAAQPYVCPIPAGVQPKY